MASNINVYEWDLGMGRDAIRLTKGHKLTEEHIDLNPQCRMRVYLAVQVNKIMTCITMSTSEKINYHQINFFRRLSAIRLLFEGKLFRKLSTTF